MGNPASAPSGSVLFIGTATTLIRFGGFTILTDPNFLHRGDEVHLGYGLRSTRQTEPALGLDQLPQLDLIILSHFHEDHFDRLVQQRLARDIPIVTTPDAARALRALGFSQVRELTTWDTWNFRRDDLRLRITAVPAQHTPLRLMQPLLPRTMGSVLSFSQVQTEEQLLRMYVSGDTLMHDDLREIPRQFPDIDVGLFHVGGTRIFGVMLTMDADQAVQAIQVVAPRVAVPIHYDDYDVFKSPLADLQRAVQAAGLTDRVRYVDRGESVPLAARSV